MSKKSWLKNVNNLCKQHTKICVYTSTDGYKKIKLDYMVVQKEHVFKQLNLIYSTRISTINNVKFNLLFNQFYTQSTKPIMNTIFLNLYRKEIIVNYGNLG